MNLKMRDGWRALREKAVESALNTWADAPQITNSAWKIDPEELRSVVIRWPSVYQWDAAWAWVEVLLYGFRRSVKVELKELPQPYRGTVLFQFVTAGKTHDVAIDYSDYSSINEESARRCPLYFKMQHLREGYGLNNVVPGGYVPDSRKIYFHLSRLRKLRDRKEFAYDVYGRFSLDYAKEVRRKAVGILSDQQSFSFEGGLKKVDYLSFLREIARAKICIDLPGEGDICHRLINYMAIGACIVGPRHRTVLHVPFLDGQHIVYTKDDFSDLVELCKFYLENNEAREDMCANSRQYFDKYLHKDNLTAYYLRSCIDRLSH
jgi:hypothetical protein